MKNNNQEFKGILRDLPFKYIFSHKNILEDFINSYYEYIKENKKYGLSNLTPESYISPNKIDIKKCFGDIVATLTNGEIILIEAYTTFNKNSYNKSLNYLTRLYSNQIKISDKDYRRAKKVTCLNLMKGNYHNKNNKLVNRYNLRNEITYKILDTEEIEMVLIRLDQIANKEYTLDKSRFIRWLKLINATSMKELEKIGKGDKIMEESIEYLKRYTGSELDHGFWDIVAEHEINAEERGEKRGKKQGILEIAKNMLTNGFKESDIIKCTGLTKKQIENIK